MIENCLKISDDVIPCPKDYDVRGILTDYIYKENLKISKPDKYFRILNNDNNIALMVIDMQKSFLKKEKIGERKRKSIINYQRSLLDICAKRDIPVIVIEYSQYGDTINPISSMVDNVPRNYFMPSKSQDSGFSVPKLYITLLKLNIRKTYIVGVNTMSCVKETAKDAIKNGIDVVVSEMGIGQPNEWEIEDGGIFFGLNGKYYSIRSVEKIIKDNRELIIRDIEIDSN